MFALSLRINLWREHNLELYSRRQPARLLFTNTREGGGGRLIRELVTPAPPKIVRRLETLVKPSSPADFLIYAKGTQLQNVEAAASTLGELGRHH